MTPILRGLAALLSMACFIGAPAQPGASEIIKVTAEPLSLSPLDPARTSFGGLALVGALTLSSDDPRFGGFSGLVVSADGTRLAAVSDEGWWFSANIDRDGGRPTGLSNARMAPLLGGDGKRPRSKSRRDAEALAAWSSQGLDGKLIVGFEQRERLEMFDVGDFGFAAKPYPLPFPKAASSGPINGEIEAVGRFFEGPKRDSLLLLSEDNFDGDGNIRGWLWTDARAAPVKIVRHADYKVTDLAILPGGASFVTLERSFSPPLPPGLALRRFAAAALDSGAPIAGDVLFEGRRPLYAIDNMEAIAARRTPDGRTMLTLMSDDNYKRSIQSTILLEFALQVAGMPRIMP